MANLLDYPLLVLVVSFFLLWLAAWVGAKLHERWDEQMGEDVRSDFEVVQAATLTLLGLIIGFSFSMATGRYDQRKNFEEAEANAIARSQLENDTQVQLAAKATVAASRAAVEQAALNLSFTKVRSLISGIAGITQVQVGNLVTPATILTEIGRASCRERV